MVSDKIWGYRDKLAVECREPCRLEWQLQNASIHGLGASGDWTRAEEVETE